MKTLVVALIACLLFAGCTSISDRIPLQTKTAKEREIATLRADFVAQMDAKSKEITDQLQKVIEGLRAQIKGASSGLYGADQTFQTIPVPDRDELIVNDFVNEAWVALGRETPTYEKMAEINARLKAALDEKVTSLEDLRKTHTAAVSENQKLTDATKQALDKLVALQAEREAMERDYRAKLERLQGELVDAQNQVIALEKARADDAKARQAQLAKLSWGAGVLAALMLAGAIWSPVFKRELGLGAAVLGGAAVAIPFVTGWWVLAGVGVTAVALILWAAKKHHTESKTAANVYRALQEVKTKSRETFDTVVKPALTQWQTVYKGGKTVPDQAAISHVDSVLREAGDI